MSINRTWPISSSISFLTSAAICLYEQCANPCLTSSWEQGGGGQYSEVGSERSNSLPRAQVEASDALALQFFTCGALCAHFQSQSAQANKATSVTLVVFFYALTFHSRDLRVVKAFRTFAAGDDDVAFVKFEPNEPGHVALRFGDECLKGFALG